MSINIVPEPGSDDHARAIAQASVSLLVASGLHATWVERDLVAVTDGRGVSLLVKVRVRSLEGIAEAVWRLFVRYRAERASEAAQRCLAAAERNGLPRPSEDALTLAVQQRARVGEQAARAAAVAALGAA